MSASEQIMAVMAARGRAKVSDISAAVEASQAAVYVALSKLVSDGELVRLEPGFYAMNIDGQPAPAAEVETEAAERETKPRKRGTKRRNGETPPPGGRGREPRRAAASRPLRPRAGGMAHRRGDRAPR